MPKEFITKNILSVLLDTESWPGVPLDVSISHRGESLILNVQPTTRWKPCRYGQKLTCLVSSPEDRLGPVEAIIFHNLRGNKRGWFLGLPSGHLENAFLGDSQEAV